MNSRCNYKMSCICSLEGHSEIVLLIIFMHLEVIWTYFFAIIL